MKTRVLFTFALFSICFVREGTSIVDEGASFAHEADHFLPDAGAAVGK